MATGADQMCTGAHVGAGKTVATSTTEQSGRAPFGDFECRGESMVFDPRRNKAPVSFALPKMRKKWRIEALVGRESGNDFITVATFALLGLALSLLAMGKGGLLYPECLTNLLLLF
jgi:hypothetical protein